MKVCDIKKLIDAAFPPDAAEEWDNIGLLLGHNEKEVKRVLLTLDVTPFSAEEAVKFGADLIISHHPILFGGTKSITDENSEGRMLLTLLENKIAVISAHTNMDSAKGGLNDYLAKLFGLKDATPVLPNKTECAGLGRIGDLEKPVTALEFALFAKEKLNTPVRLSGNETKTVKRVALGSGASDDIVFDAVKMGADLVLTGDCKYHRNQTYTDLGIAVVDAGHYPTEIMAMDIFERLLKDCNIEIKKSENRDIFKFI